jgi:hypothetical protein
MKKLIVTLTLAALTIMSWATVILADGGGGGP